MQWCKTITGEEDNSLIIRHWTVTDIKTESKSFKIGDIIIYLDNEVGQLKQISTYGWKDNTLPSLYDYLKVSPSRVLNNIGLSDSLITLDESLFYSSRYNDLGDVDDIYMGINTPSINNNISCQEYFNDIYYNIDYSIYSEFINGYDTNTPSDTL